MPKNTTISTRGTDKTKAAAVSLGGMLTSVSIGAAIVLAVNSDLADAAAETLRELTLRSAQERNLIDEGKRRIWIVPQPAVAPVPDGS